MPIQHTDTKALYELYRAHPSITTDSRQIAEGQIFFALSGERFDGNKFALQAIESGAAYAIVSDPELLRQSDKLRWVPDTLAALQALARWHREQLQIPLIAITGTNGKTTTKELTQRVLATRYKTFATKGNLNNHIGVPLSILSIKPDHEIAIIEMGASSVGEIAVLCHIAHPTHGLVTNIGSAHLEGFGSVEGVLQAKSELPHFLQSKGGTFFLNLDDPLLHNEWKDMAAIGYGVHHREGVLSGEVKQGFPHLQMSLSYNHQSYHLNSQMVGGYNATNTIAALSVGIHFGVPLEEGIDAIEHYRPDNNRSEMMELPKGIHLIADAYNANPSSMHAALESFAEATALHKLVILGDMLELGTHTAKEHDEVIQWLLRHPEIDALLIGKAFAEAAKKYSSTALRFFSTSDEAAHYLKVLNIEAETLILLKGSRGGALEQLIPLLSK